MTPLEQIERIQHRDLCPGMKEDYRIAAWVALRDCRAMYTEGNIRGVLNTMKRVRKYRHMARISPTMKETLETRQACAVVFGQRQARWLGKDEAFAKSLALA